ncbi:MAG: hypothetical protein DMG05_04840 [Acidobacteria bacterium]|nr:MAG: hypothetical protein DMG05_04840 [Acidobacteriota bacterium]
MDETTNATSGQPVLPPVTPVEPRYKGVGGWLLFFCLGLTVFNPLMSLFSLAGSYRESAPYFSQFPGLLVVTGLDTVLSLGLTVFSIYAGASLWRLRPGAVQTAKRYFLWFLAYQAVAIVLPFMAALPSAPDETMIAQTVKGAFRGIIYVIIWYSYLNKSERVRATYLS